jgi:hypothetical protein
MTAETLRDARNARPFSAFTIVLKNGDAVPVPDPERLAISPSGRAAIVYRDDDTHTNIDLRYVAGVEVL